MAHPKHDPRTVDSTRGDIQSITSRYSEPESIARILAQRANLARNSGAKPEIIAMYQAELDNITGTA